LSERLRFVAPFLFRNWPMDLLKLEPVSLSAVNLTEKWVQDQLSEDPSILGLGDLEMRDYERIQPRAGRLDLLLQDPDTRKRYEVEIQLGATDESHIIRTIEYWDIERKRYPQYEHAAVIVAEDITSRFLNVIQLFNGAIPLVALKMTAFKVNDAIAITFVKVLDEVTLGLVDEDEPKVEPTTRESWETKASKKTLADTDGLLKLVKEIQPKATLNYNKHYIGLEIDGASRNFVAFRPKKAHVIMEFKLPDQGEDMKRRIEEADMRTVAYDSQFRFFRISIDRLDIGKQCDVLRGLIRQAWELYGKP
jgi:hypothetical protein